MVGGSGGIYGTYARRVKLRSGGAPDRSGLFLIFSERAAGEENLIVMATYIKI
jgi:hypothetical protein